MPGYWRDLVHHPVTWLIIVAVFLIIGVVVLWQL